MEVIKDPKIHAALELLNAYAKEKADDLGDLVTRNYGQLKKAVTKGTATAIRKYPWAVVGGAAAALLGLGLLVGKLTRQNKK
jgi:ElaB/YqjD/DUF883 family membrane-anchored ribosome-binding protein